MLICIDVSKFSYRTIYILLNSQSTPHKEKIIHNKNVNLMRILQKLNKI